jgi:signal transduction histidine kinase
MSSMLRLSRWPLTVKAPFIVALLMIGVAVAISKVVLNRLDETQEQHFRQLSGAFLDGLSTALHPHLIRQDTWEAFDVLDRSRGQYSGVVARTVLVILPNETILAALDPIRIPIHSEAPEVSRPATPLATLAQHERLIWVHRSIEEGGIKVGRIAAEIDVSELIAFRSQTLWTLVAVNSGLTLLLAAVGWLLVHKTLSPLARLSGYLANAGEGRLEPIPTHHLPPADTEAGRAYRAYNAAAASIAEREALLRRLVEEERRALSGRYASALAHEVNNPLGGMFNALRMIQRHGEDDHRRSQAATLLERGLNGIRNIVSAALMVWRGEGDKRNLSTGDVDDVRYLVESEAARREITLKWMSQIDGAVPVPAQAFRQIALNLLLNACAATPPGGTVLFAAVSEEGSLIIRVNDEGPGMPTEAKAVLCGLKPASAAAASGLGLWTIARILAEFGGTVRVENTPGSSITVSIPHVSEQKHETLAA